jgi:uncharacterized protein YoxC
MKEYERGRQAEHAELIEAVQDLRRAVDDLRAQVGELTRRLAASQGRQPGMPSGGPASGADR